MKSGLVIRSKLEGREQSSRSRATELNLFSVRKEEKCRPDFSRSLFFWPENHNGES